MVAAHADASRSPYEFEASLVCLGLLGQPGLNRLCFKTTKALHYFNYLVIKAFPKGYLVYTNVNSLLSFPLKLLNL